jgi:hypothetical protein
MHRNGIHVFNATATLTAHAPVCRRRLSDEWCFTCCHAQEVYASTDGLHYDRMERVVVSVLAHAIQAVC